MVKLKKGKWKDIEVTLIEMETGEEEEMYRKTVKYSMKGSTPNIDIPSPLALGHWRVFYSIESPASLRNIEEIRKLKRSDFYILLKEVDKLNPLAGSEDKSEEQSELGTQETQN